jgi:ketosteroid isomerase-like protein
MAQEHIQTILTMYAAFASKDVDSVRSLFDPKVEWNAAENFLYADGNPYIGHDAVMNGIFKRLAEDWAEFSVTADEILGDGNLVIARGRFRGIFNANGASVNAQFVQVFQFEGNKIVKVQMYTDTAQFKDTIARARLANV